MKFLRGISLLFRWFRYKIFSLYPSPSPPTQYVIMNKPRRMLRLENYVEKLAGNMRNNFIFHFSDIPEIPKIIVIGREARALKNFSQFLLLSAIQQNNENISANMDNKWEVKNKIKTREDLGSRGKGMINDILTTKYVYRIFDIEYFHRTFEFRKCEIL